MSVTDPILSRLHAQRDALADAVRRLEWSGLGDGTAAIVCRRYLRKVEHWIADPRGVAGLCGENGYAPAFRDAVKDAEFELSRLAPVVIVSAQQVAA